MTKRNDQGSEGSVARDALAFLASLFVLCGLMYYTYTYPYPSGRPSSWGSFAAFWLRELLILLFALLVALAIVAGWLRRLYQHWRGEA